MVNQSRVAEQRAVQAKLGAALRAVRESKRYTLANVELLTMGRYHMSALSGWERGDRVMRVTTFLDLCEFYRVSPKMIVSNLAAGLAAEERSQRKPSRSLSRGSDNGTAR